MGERRLVVAFVCAVLASGSTEAFAQSGGPQFRVLSPLAGSLQGNSVEVRIAITSQTPIAAAGATLENAGIPLSPDRDPSFAARSTRPRCRADPGPSPSRFVT